MEEQICIMMTTMMAATALAGCSDGAREATAAPTAAKITAETAQAPTTGEKTETESSAGETTATQTEESTEILAAAAASLKNTCEDELIPMFQEQYPGVVIKGTHDSSDRLQTQVEEGLRTDIFVSAATKQVTVLDEEGMVESDIVTDLLENKIAFIALTGNSAGFEKSENVEKAESIALGDPAGMLAGQYTQEALTDLGIWGRIQSRADFGTSAMETLNQVAALSADTDIVYATDTASMTNQVQVVTEAPKGSLEGKVIYPVAVVRDTAHAEEAKNLMEFPETDEAMKVFKEYGSVKGE